MRSLAFKSGTQPHFLIISAQAGMIKKINQFTRMIVRTNTNGDKGAFKPSETQRT